MSTSSTQRVIRVSTTPDPLPSFAFHVEIAGVEEAAFTSVSGIAMRRENDQIRQGGENAATHYVSKQLSFTPLTLERGVARSDYLWTWFNKGAEDGKVERLQMTVRQYEPYVGNSTPVREYIFYDCVPLSWTGPTFTASSNDIAIERLEIGFGRFELKLGA